MLFYPIVLMVNNMKIDLPVRYCRECLSELERHEGGYICQNKTCKFYDYDIPIDPRGQCKSREEIINERTLSKEERDRILSERKT